MRHLFRILMLTAAAHSHAAIYVCEDERGQKTFTDRGCPQARLYAAPPTTATAFEPLTATERRRLEQLQRRAAADQRAARAARLRHREQAARLAASRARACAAAKAQLRKLAERRRKGYALAAQPRLDAQRTALEADKNANC